MKRSISFTIKYVRWPTWPHSEGKDKTKHFPSISVASGLHFFLQPTLYILVCGCVCVSERWESEGESVLVCVCMYVCNYVYVCVYVCVCGCVCLKGGCVRDSICLCTCTCVCPCVRVSVCLCVCVSVCL